MGASENRELIKRYFALVMRGEGDPTEVFADDVTWHLPRSNPTNADGPYDSRARVLEMLAAGVAMYDTSSMSTDVHAVVADDDFVAVRLTFRTRTAAGRDYEGEYQFQFECRGGRIVNVWEAPDTLYQDQMGVFDAWRSTAPGS